jgi:hypothetical protein
VITDDYVHERLAGRALGDRRKRDSA